MDETYVKLNGKWIYLYRAVDRCGSNKAALDALNIELDQDHKIQIFQNKYLNNIVEQGHRFIKKRIKPMLGFKRFHSAVITIKEIENIRIIQKGQIIGSKKQVSTFGNFAKIMAAQYPNFKTKERTRKNQPQTRQSQYRCTKAT